MSSIVEIIRLIQAGGTLNANDTESVFGEIMRGDATPAQIGALLMGISIRGETSPILAGAARAMRAAATRIHPRTTGLLDTCGTGGDGASTFNISTAAALVVAAAGVPVAKHGNRAISSKSGSADVLEALGVRLDIPPDKVAQCIDEVGIGFLFAPTHHPAIKYAASPRRELGTRTVFNLLGPLTNPAGVQYQVIGVYAKDKLELLANALRQLGVKRALVVHGADGLDEITTTTTTDAIMVERNHPPQCFQLDPAAFGIPFTTVEGLAGGDAAHNATIIRHILAGQTGAGRDIVLLNTAAALWVCGQVTGIPDGLQTAAETIDSGRAQSKLNQLIEFTRRLP